jgi:hypothetical protein
MMHPWPVTLRTALARCTLVAAAAIMVGCDADAADPVEPPHSIHQPWQAEPFSVDQGDLARALAACRDVGLEAFQSQTTQSLVAVDARGGSRLFLVSADRKTESDCFVDIDPFGRTTPDGAGSTSGLPFQQLNPGAIEMVSSSSGSSDANTMSQAVGRAGPGVARVVVTLANGRQVVASLSQSGWWAGWWPGATSATKMTAYDSSGAVTGTAP